MARGRIRKTYAYMASGFGLMGLSGWSGHCLGGATVLAAHPCAFVAVGLAVPLACALLTRTISPRRLVCKHAAWVGLNVGLGIALSFTGAWGCLALLTSVLAIAGMAVMLCRFIPADGDDASDMATVRSLDGPIGAAMLGVTLGPALLPLLAPGVAALVAQACVGGLGFAIVSIFLAIDMRRIHKDASSEADYDAVGRSVALHVQLLSLYLSFGKAVVALTRLRRRVHC